MKTRRDQSGGIKPLVDELVSTLTREYAMLEELEQRLTDKLEAIRSRDAEQLSETTHDISQTNQKLDRLAETRGRQVQLLGQALGNVTPVNSLDDLRTSCQHHEASEISETIRSWQTKMRRQAFQTQERCEEVTFALQYATRLGQEMLQALRGESPERGTSGTEGYTSTGTPASSSQTSSFVNHVG